MPRRIDPASIAETGGASYPPPFDRLLATRTRRHLGDAAGFPCGEGVGQHFQNRSDKPATILAIGSRNPDDVCHYPDLDLVAGTRDGKAWFTHLDGTPYPGAPTA